jgi:hypothetical protein
VIQEAIKTNLAARSGAFSTRIACIAGALVAGVTLSLGSAEAADANIAVPPAGPTIRLISQTEYVNTIGQVFGTDIIVDMLLAPVNRAGGLLAVGASNAFITPGILAPLDRAGRAVAAQVVDVQHRTTLVPCVPASSHTRDDQCARAFFAKVGRMVYRRKLTDSELASFVDLAGSATETTGDFYSGLADSLSGMLVSPEFLFIKEDIEPDPAAPGAWRLSAYSKASRLSMLLWDSGPDDALLAAAERGDLDQPAGVRRQVDRLLASPRYKNGVRAFLNDFLVLEGLYGISKDPTIYPDFALTAVESAREQLLQTAVDHLVTQHGDYRDLFTTRRTFLKPDLGVLYHVPVNASTEAWVPYEFDPDSPRAGILTQIGFLAQYAHPGRSSSTRRGRAIREVLLCQKVPDPPPNVDFSNFENPKSPLPTARERLMRHQQNPVCAGCHRVTDPIGLALENFNGAGQFRETENGAPINASGALDGVTFNDAVGLGQALRNNAALRSCIVNRLYQYSVGREVKREEQPLLASYQATFDKRGYRLDEMLRLMILQKSFFSARPTQVAATAAGGSNAR